jgi:hypothetical protein
MCLDLFLSEFFNAFCWMDYLSVSVATRVIIERRDGVIGIPVSYSGGSVFNSRPADLLS